MKNIFYLSIILIAACNAAPQKKTVVALPTIFNGITITPLGLTCNDAQLQNTLGKIVKTNDTLTTNTNYNFKLFMTGYTPINGMVNLQGTLTITNALTNQVCFTNNNYFTNAQISNGDARYISMPFNLNTKLLKPTKLKCIATLIEVNTGAKIQAAFEVVGR